MAEVITMPKLSDTMEEGVIAAWHKKIGDQIKTGDVIAEVETDKATMDLEAFQEGTLLHIAVNEKEAVPINGMIAIVGEKGENVDELIQQHQNNNGSTETKEAPEPAREKEETAQDSSEAVDTSNINAKVITMPLMSDTMEEGRLVQWHKNVGDKVSSGDVMAEVETDKATMDMEAFEEGTLLYKAVNDGDTVKVHEIIAVVGEEGADYESLIKAHKQPQKQEASAQESGGAAKPDKPQKAEQAAAQQPAAKAEPASGQNGSGENGRIKASPLARKMAKEKGIDLKKVQGSGDYGRIIKRDIENYKPAEEAVASAADTSMPMGEESYEEVGVSQMRKTIAKRLSESKFTSPHFYLTMEIDMDKTIAARKSINEYLESKVSFNDIVIKAASMALKKHPKVNANWMGDKIRYNHHVHMGVAVAVEEGLLVPVLRFAATKSLSAINEEVKALASKAKNKKLQPQEMEGNTFTISNLGMYGIEEFTAIINPPDACIMAIGGINEKPVVKNGEVVPGNVMKVTLSCDHRVVDGAVGSEFLQTFKAFMEDPVRIIA